MRRILRKIHFHKMKDGMLRAGLPLVCIGALVLSVSVLTGLSSNAVLILSVLSVMAGTLLYVLSLKRKSDY